MLTIANTSFSSRLLTGTGKFSNAGIMLDALASSGTELVTLALRRLDRRDRDAIFEPLQAAGYRLLPNTSGARTAEEAIQAAQLTREAMGTPWLKLEIHPDPRYLLPDPVETLKAAERLVQLGFIVLPYVHADPVLCKRLEEAGCAAVMPLAAPIGSNQGLVTAPFLDIIIEQSRVPVIVDAGLGAPSQAAEAMERGADAVLVNTAIATATDPVAMAAAFKAAVDAGYQARQAGLATPGLRAAASSPLTAFLESGVIPMQADHDFQPPDWQTSGLSLYAKTAADVERALARPQRTTDDLMALLSPAARPYLETMAQLSHQLTVQRFGRVQQLFAPLYVSNACANECDYCGFSMSNRVRRKVLTAAELAMEVAYLKRQGFEHVLLVAGEAPRVAGVDYFERALQQLGPEVAQISLEVQPMSTEDYRRLHRAGLHAVLVYQETYHRPTYHQYHTRGNKADYDHRLAALGRAGAAGIHRLGMGVLLGLADWRLDSLMAAHHLRYLERRCWRSRFSMSFPRLRPAEGGFVAPHPLSDADLVQLICAWRLFSPDLELSLSTREPAALREHLLPLGVTSLSAGSSTRPGGYAVEPDIALEQFSIDDNRTLKDVVAAVQRLDYQPVWKDWDPQLHVSK